MVSRRVEIAFTEKGASRVVSSLNEIERAAKRTAGTTAKSFDDSAKKLSGSFSKIGTGAGLKGLTADIAQLRGGATAAAIAGLTALAGGMISAVNAGREQLKATRLTEAVLKSTGGQAGITGKEVEGLASKLSLVSGVQDEVIQSGENVLLTFTQVKDAAGKGNDIFTQGTTAALDLSAALGQDLQSSVIQVGKALNDPIAGMTALKRVGVSFTESQREQIKVLAKSGDTLGAQKVILKELQTEFGGAAAAAADPFSKLNVQLKEVKETIGVGLVPAVSSYVKVSSQAISTTTSFEQAVAKHTGGMGKLITTFAGLAPGIGPGIQQIAAFANLTHKSAKEIDPAAKAAQKLADAEKKLANDTASGHASRKQLADDVSAVKTAQAEWKVIQDAVNGALGTGTIKAKEGAFAYLGLADAAATASQALGAISNRATVRIGLRIDTGKAAGSLQDALDKLHPVAEATTSGGGKTATASALEQASKQTAVRDALLGVKDAAVGVTAAQKTLTQAQKDSATAAQELKTAQRDYETVLHGVAAGSKDARAAQDALTQAQDASKSSALDLLDAQRGLADAIDTQRNAARNAREAAGSASRGLTGAQLDLKDAQAALGRARQTEDPETIARAQLAVGDAQQRVSDAVQARTEAQKHLSDVSKGTADEDENVKRANIALTEAQLKNKQAGKDQTEAQRVLNGTLHGFPPTAQESKDALVQLTQAQDTARSSADAVTTAQRGLITATNNTADASLALQQAQADLAGKLDSAAGSATKAKGSFRDYIETVLDAKQAVIDFGVAQGQEATAAAQRAGKGIFAATAAGVLAEIGAIKTAVANEPLLVNAFEGVYSALQQQYANLQIQAAAAHAPDVPHTQTYAATRASGGPVNAGRPYLIGEKGPELFVPRQSGEVVSHASLAKSQPYGGGQVKVEVHIHGNVYGVADLERVVVGAVQKHYRNGGQSLSSRPR